MPHWCSRKGDRYTEAEVQRWLQLRAIEWSNWPAFISQLIVPILLLRVPALSVLLALALADLLWRFVSTSWISMTLVRIGPDITLLKWPSAIVCACVLSFSHRFGIAALALAWPIIGSLVSVVGSILSVRLGIGTIGAVERALAARIGYAVCSVDAHDLGPPDNSGHPCVRTLRIVSLDDEPFMGDMLKMMFQFEFPDSIVLTYTDAELALRELEREDPDVFITDWNHPGRLHGGGLLQELANKGVSYPVVVTSAMGQLIASPEILGQFINQGLNVTLLSKPFSADDLRTHIAACLDSIGLRL